MNRRTILPEYIDVTVYEEDGTPFEGDQLRAAGGLESSFEDLCILRFTNGRLHGKFAVETCTGYMEEWQNGKYIASMSLCSRRKKKGLNTKELNDMKMATIQNEFKNRKQPDKKNMIGDTVQFAF